jgi:phytoene/squalene synthetase
MSDATIADRVGLCGRLCRNLFADRRRPPLDRLSAETDPARFVWSVLPHAARSFGLAIAFLPGALARPLAAAYLWCRALDTIEDLARDDAAREAGFRALLLCVRGEGPPPTSPRATIQDDRDRAHLLLLRRAPLLLRYTEALSAESRARIVALVETMARGMEAAARKRRETGGLLDAGKDREAYCRAVLAEPLLFAEAELRATCGDPPLDATRRDLAHAAGELIQLANVCRDVEKDLARGVAYDRALVPYLASGRAPEDVAAGARARVLSRVAELGPSVEPYFAGLPLKGRPGARAAAAVMCAATASFFQRANRRLPNPVLRDVGPPGRSGVAYAAGVASLGVGPARRAFARLSRAFERAGRAGAAPVGALEASS